MDLKLQKYFFVFILIGVVLSADNTSPQRLPCESWAPDGTSSQPLTFSYNFGFGDKYGRFITKAVYAESYYRLSWYDAFAWCRSRGMLLASPETEGENLFLIQNLQERGLLSSGEKKNDYWLSLANFSKNKHAFVWMSTGMKVHYSGWGKRNLNNLTYNIEEERCGQLYTENNYTAWGVYNCNCPQNFICEQISYGYPSSWPRLNRN